MGEMSDYFIAQEMNGALHEVLDEEGIKHYDIWDEDDEQDK